MNWLLGGPDKGAISRNKRVRTLETDVAILESLLAKTITKLKEAEKENAKLQERIDYVEKKFNVLDTEAREHMVDMMNPYADRRDIYPEEFESDSE